MGSKKSQKHDIAIALANIISCDDGKLLRAGVCRSWLGLGPEGFRTKEKPHPISIIPYQKEYITESIATGIQTFISQMHVSSTMHDAAHTEKLMMPHTYGYNAIMAWSKYIFRCGTGKYREGRITQLQNLGIAPPYFLCDRIRTIAGESLGDFRSTYQNYLNGGVVSRKSAKSMFEMKRIERAARDRSRDAIVLSLFGESYRLLSKESRILVLKSVSVLFSFVWYLDYQQIMKKIPPRTKMDWKSFAALLLGTQEEDSDLDADGVENNDGDDGSEKDDDDGSDQYGGRRTRSPSVEFPVFAFGTDSERHSKRRRTEFSSPSTSTAVEQESLRTSSTRAVSEEIPFFERDGSASIQTIYDKEKLALQLEMHRMNQRLVDKDERIIELEDENRHLKYKNEHLHKAFRETGYGRK